MIVNVFSTLGLFWNIRSSGKLNCLHTLEEDLSNFRAIIYHEIQYLFWNVGKKILVHMFRSLDNWHGHCLPMYSAEKMK
jgi:hypothetical protein